MKSRGPLRWWFIICPSGSRVKQLTKTVPISGTWTIISSCNGTAQITQKGESTEHYNLTVPPLEGASFPLRPTPVRFSRCIHGRWKKPAAPPTGTSGTFGFAGSGSVVGVGNLANGGQVALDGAGHLTGTESISFGDRISSDVAFTGPCKVNKNCSGTAMVKVKGQPTVHLTFALVRQLQSIFFVETDANTVIAGWDRE